MIHPERTALRAATRAKPCELCGGDHKCSRGEDGLLVCGRRHDNIPNYVRIGPCEKDGQFTLYRREGDPRLEERRHSLSSRSGQSNANQNSEPVKPLVDWQARAETF